VITAALRGRRCDVIPDSGGVSGPSLQRLTTQLVDGQVAIQDVEALILAVMVM
jgi:hypothetical protein